MPAAWRVPKIWGFPLFSEACSQQTIVTEVEQVSDCENSEDDSTNDDNIDPADNPGDSNG